MGRDAVFGGAMHFEGANLHLKGFAGVDHRGVQRLVHIGLGHGNIVLKPPRHLRPEGMHHAQGEIAILHGIDDDPDGDQVVDLIEGLVLGLHLAIDGQ